MKTIPLFKIIIVCVLLQIVICCNSFKREKYLPETDMAAYVIPDYATFQWRFKIPKDSIMQLFGNVIYKKYAAELKKMNELIKSELKNDSTLSTIGLDGYRITIFKGIKIKEEYNRQASTTKMLDSSFTIIHVPYTSPVWDSLKKISSTPDLIEHLRESCKTE
ncbi:MAG: hypothetical protein IJO23_05410 [Bacteroidales bacterium]|nr:hypothetical protein [Bacteroidales bacterium]